MTDKLWKDHRSDETNLDVIAEAYLRYYWGKKKEDFWALDRVWDLVHEEPNIALELTLLMVKRVGEDDSALAYVAAGPLEDLLKMHGPQVIEQIETACIDDKRLQLALTGVWGIGPGHPVFECWYALKRKYGFTEGKRHPL